MSLKSHSYFSVSSFRVPIRNTADYSPFGVQLDGRTIQGDFYRYGFNGMEGDSEFKGQGNSYTTEFRQYDARLGRWLSLDPLMAKYPWQSPYCAMDNKPNIVVDPTGESGEVTINKKTKTIIISSHIIFYGSCSNSELAKNTAKDIQNKWNSAKGKVKIDGVVYKVKFSITGEHRSDLTPWEVATNLDLKNNYVRVEKEHPYDASFMDDVGSNTGYFLLKHIIKDGSTTEAHEFGHGIGLIPHTWDGHPNNSDLRGKGQPGIMNHRGVLVDSEFQYDPNSVAGTEGGTLNPEKRIVKQSDIDMLRLDKLQFNRDGKAGLGSLTNKFHKKEKNAKNH